jgi:hypothetical protein
MTAKQLISKLQATLDKRGGKDLDVMLDVDFQKTYPIASAIELTHLTDEPDLVLLSNWEAHEECDKYDGGIHCTPEQSRWN